MQTKFYRCKICGNVIVKLSDSGVVPHCCAREMEELVPKTKDVYMEKHVPIVTRIDECTIVVDVSSFEHPMTPEHHIEWIYVETKNGGRFKQLAPTGKPQVKISCKSEPTAVYAYCNIHGLWMWTK